ncbi:neuronal growth regulator 1 isoform X1 [Lepeophtheirus salmonis]|uniref:neuronal growth regulator 1 isoform X1 n=2 Tax=Lepeophtheirus salmonis TaxID=72036 RepID=UPI003AF34AC8
MLTLLYSIYFISLYLFSNAGEVIGKTYFMTPSQTYRSKIGDSVNMDCDVLSLGSTIITWYKGDRIISAGNLKILEDPRIQINVKQGRGIQIIIQNVHTQDQGIYSCEVNFKDNPIKLSHNLEILVPPVIKSINGGRNSIRVKQGSKVALNCTASGHPKPLIHWEREHRNYFPNGQIQEKGALLLLPAIHHTYAGTYICVANNNVTLPVKSEVRVEVMYVPEVQVDSSWVHTGSGKKAILACYVKANPNPEVDWYKGSMKLSDGERHTLRKTGNRYMMFIQNITVNDFGNYSCQAQNEIGKAKKELTTITLTGSPTKPIITSIPSGQNRYSFHLQWTVMTSYPIRRHIIYIWRLPNTDQSISNDISKLMVPDPQKKIVRIREQSVQERHMFDHNNETQSFENNLKGLAPATGYGAQVKTENMIGWSPLSDLFIFTTSHIENIPKELSSKIEDEEITPAGILNVPSSSSTFSSSNSISSVCSHSIDVIFLQLVFIFNLRNELYSLLISFS